jgi:menaquinone-dependent protoporphyrinogen oxidase
MRTAIIYVTKHGTTAKVAQKIQEGIGVANTDMFNLKDNSNIDLSKYEQVIIGGSIHAGSIQKRITHFCNEHTVDLVQKPLGLFICCMDEKHPQSEFENAFPELLRSHAKSKKIMGGEFLIEKMNFIEKLIIKKVSKVTSTISKIDEGKIKEMVEEMRG